MATAHHFFTKESAEIGPFEPLPHPPEQLVASAYAPKMSQKAQALNCSNKATLLRKLLHIHKSAAFIHSRIGITKPVKCEMLLFFSSTFFEV